MKVFVLTPEFETFTTFESVKEARKYVKQCIQDEYEDHECIVKDLEDKYTIIVGEKIPLFIEVKISVTIDQDALSEIGSELIDRVGKGDYYA